ncbi:nuclear pore complex protein NUP1 isoform X2 [Momordica charantia]|uniref:Nuclear pore complex protein NUP1 isoform X2 n=1 Tax=Momordica charantia TaxID=3673 RepID=A0A6J1CT79_MOMCH|nr:nuclear pore complex protein NUP1 isoform X2 [Momordica charantia]
MERADQRTSSTPYGGGGVGGKLRKPTSRKPPPTPYARPEQNQSHRRWLSKLVDPAYRLITGGATRLLPYLFSKSLPSNALPSPGDEDHDKVEAEVEANVSGEDELRNVNKGTSSLPGLPGPGGKVNRSENKSDFNGHQKERENDVLAGNINFDVEKWIQGKTFSRDEVSHLLEIIQSKALAPSNKVEDKKFSPQSIEKQAEQPSAANRVLKMPHQEKQEDLERAMWGNLTPHPQSSKLNEVVASPVDIARAYMSGRKSQTSLLPDKTPGDERALLHSDHQMSKPLIPSMSPNPSTCWPGAMSESQRGYLTPRSQRGRFGLHNFPRTPYSRSIFSKSKSKLTELQGDAQKFVNTPAPLWQQPRTTAYGQMTSSNDSLDEATGSIGPIRRLRHKASAATNSRRSAYFYASSQPETKVENCNILKGILPDSKKNLELGGASTVPLSYSVGNNNSESSLLIVRPPSSQVARTILEHISRNPPTPKEKTEELKRAIAWKKSPSPDVHTITPNGTNSLAIELDSRQKAYQGDQNCHPQLMSDKGKTVSTVLPEESVGRDSDAVNQHSSNLKFRLGHADLTHKGDAGLKINSTSPKDVTKIVPAIGSEEGTKIKPSPSLGIKPGFPSITINKPESKWAFSSDSGSGFTFPVSGASSGTLSEPPTPSIFPSTSIGGSQPLLLKPETAAVSSYSFGSKKSSPTLVFSFSSTNSDTIYTDARNIKFSFGSNDHTRLSFGSVGKDADAVCC